MEGDYMQYRIQAANPDRYDHDACFSKYGFIDWGLNANLSVGDIVYLYFSANVRKIRYKTCVEKIIDKEKIVHVILMIE